MTFDQYVQMAERSFRENRMLRKGQYLFNTLYAVRPDIADQLRATEVDCFYRDVLIPAFLQEVERLW